MTMMKSMRLPHAAPRPAMTPFIARTAKTMTAMDLLIWLIRVAEAVVALAHVMERLTATKQIVQRFLAAHGMPRGIIVTRRAEAVQHLAHAQALVRVIPLHHVLAPDTIGARVTVFVTQVLRLAPQATIAETIYVVQTKLPPRAGLTVAVEAPPHATITVSVIPENRLVLVRLIAVPSLPGIVATMYAAAVKLPHHVPWIVEAALLPPHARRGITGIPQHRCANLQVPPLVLPGKYGMKQLICANRLPPAQVSSRHS